MSTTIAVRFPWGRYHATPWGRHVNEAAIEFPPSPWRLLRALFSTWKGRAPELDEATVHELLEQLLAPPSYRVPEYIEAHTRHYMPDITDGTDKVIDAFAVFERDAELLVTWPVDIDEAQRSALAVLVERLPYIGRAESICDARIVPTSNAPVTGTLIEPLTDDQLRALLKACTPPKGSTPAEMLRHRRDEAILRLMMETGARAGEVVALERADVDAAAGTAIIRRGKGGKGRIVPFGPHTALALDRYMRLRTHHRLASSPALWLGDRGKGFTYDALHQALAGRATAAGIVGFHPHKMRHTAAHRWLAAGGSEGGLMAVAGWTRPDMLMRYTKAQASSRAAAEARGLNLGEL